MAGYRKEIFRQRSYQLPAWEARRQGKRRFIKLWHRRAGKDRDGASFCLSEMLQRDGVYFHIFPSLNQARRDFWDNILKETVDGKERSVKVYSKDPHIYSIFPAELVAHVDDKEMQITLINGAIYQLMGCDDDEAVERLRGPNPIGLLFSEFAHGSKMEKAWNTLIPVLAENKGWAMFVYTPNGLNHGYDLWKNAVADPEGWFTQRLTIDETRRDAKGEDGTPVVTIDEINQLRKNGIREEFIQQEFYCSFTGFQHGTIYGELIAAAEEAGRITDIPYVINQPVGAILDIGKSDVLSCWYYQKQGEAIKFIDYWEKSQAGLKEWEDVTHFEKRYRIGRIVLPWDGWQAEEFLTERGHRNIRVCERTKSVPASIELVRRTFSQFYWDASRCAVGLDHLRKYSRKWDDDKRVFSAQPNHDEHSHGADALRTGVEGGFDPIFFANWQGEEVKVITDFDPRMVG